MNTKTAVVILVFVLMGGIFLLFRGRFAENILDTGKSREQINTKQSWETKTDDQSAVAITITPIDILSSSPEWKFDVAMNTHSIELKSPMISIVLVDDKGNEYKPIAWDGPTEGHHMNGALIFDKIIPMSKSIVLKVKNSDNISGRLFKWNLEEKNN